MLFKTEILSDRDLWKMRNEATHAIDYGCEVEIVVGSDYSIGIQTSHTGGCENYDPEYPPTPVVETLKA